MKGLVSLPRRQAGPWEGVEARWIGKPGLKAIN